MAKQFLLSLPALAFANSVNAQSFPKPADVPAYVSVTPLYKTDGTPAGTALVADTSAVTGGGVLSNFFALSGTLYFTSDKDGAGTKEFWTTDGTEAGTKMLEPSADIETGMVVGNVEVVLGRVGGTRDIYTWITK